VPADRDPQPVRCFGAFTADLIALAKWLQACRVDTVAIESTGVYWIPLFEVLEERGIEVKVVDPRRLAQVPGRKSDVLDCQWIQQLHTFGLLAGAFRPVDQIVVLRSYMRQREMLVRYQAQHIQHMQKAMEQMNLKLTEVISDVTGVTGTRIIEAILGGERDAKKLAALRHERCHNNAETIALSLQGKLARRAPVFPEAGGGSLPLLPREGLGSGRADRIAPEEIPRQERRVKTQEEAGATQLQCAML